MLHREGSNHRGQTRHDTERKKQLHEQFAVPEYWIVEPDEYVLSRYLLDADSTFANDVESRNVITFDRIPGVANVDLSRVW